MAVDFVVEGLAQRDGIFEFIAVTRAEGSSRLYQMCMRSKKWKRAESGHDGSLALLFRAEKDGGAKDALKALNDPVVVVSVLGQFEVVEHLRGTGKPDQPTLLENREGRDPNGDEAVLAKRQTEPRVPDDIEGELAVAPGMGELVYRGSPQRNATEDERASVVGEFLLAVSALLAHQADGIELFDFALRETDRRQYGLKRVE